MKNQNVKLSIPMTAVSSFKGHFENLPPNEIYTLLIDYPYMDNYPSFKIKTGKNGLGFIELIAKIGDIYSKIYDDEDTDGRYGIFGHDIDDLAIEGIHINSKNKTIKLSIGS